MNNRQDWVPQWAKTVVWYQIFPDRFRNGDPAGNPTLADIEGAWPHDLASPWQIHPWTSDWYELQPYEQANGQNIVFNLVRRRYGGDLQGIIDQLDYLQDLGITALYLNPVFQSPSHHKYDGVVYHHIDGTLGPDPEGDKTLMAQEDPGDPATWVWTAADKLALQLIQDVHRRGMRIIFDGVFNHVSLRNPMFQDVVKNQQQSRYKEWFSIDSWDDAEQGTKFSYRGWWNVAELPEWRQDEHGTVAGPRQYIFDCTRRWMSPHGEPQDGIDGWRLDVAYCVKHPFWKAWRKHVKSINPEAYLTAEVIDPIDVLQPYLEGDEFDAVMNYNVGFACADYFINEEKRITTSEFDILLRDLRQAFDEGVSYVQQNLMDSHDANRLASHIVNRDGERYRDWLHYFHTSKAIDNPDYEVRKPTAAEYAVQKLIALFMMTYVGAPMIYYGDEVGMWGANDPCCRKPMVWADLDYEPERFLPDGTTRATADPVAVNLDLLNTYQRLIAIRHQYPALSLGDFQTLLTDDQPQIYAYRRRFGGQTVIVALNNTRQAQTVELEAPAAGTVTDVLNDQAQYPVEGGKIRVSLPPLWGAILLKDEG
ncbi:MAG: alpha-glucosidase C-terminal domain-containing protein [Anaerolineales bacterium]|nr:alpha-glucosidase C-terminal domain-containing protein [Anaerolineales bacterium]